MRLDFEVSRRFGLSRRAARDAVRAGRVDVNGETLELPGADVAAGARVELVRDRPARRTVRTRLAVLHEDPDVIVVDKPAGLVDRSDRGAREGHALEPSPPVPSAAPGRAAVCRHRAPPRQGHLRCGRLRAQPAGAARAAGPVPQPRHRARVRRPGRRFAARLGTFDADLVRTRELRRTVARAGEEGRRAVTRFEVLERLRGAALVSVRPETGRTHQIRVHFSAAGYPILGDKVYRGSRGEIPESAPRQMLHARRLGFVLPESARVSVEAPIPDDFRHELEIRRRGAERNAPAESGSRVPPARADSNTRRTGAKASPPPPAKKAGAPFRRTKPNAPFRSPKSDTPVRAGKEQPPFRRAKEQAPFRGAKEQAPFRGARNPAPFRGGKNAPAGAGASRSRDRKGTTRGR